ncbi:(2Fe-2S)-binding protein [Peribacillus kribbensis]|uniref:(2Fe-2S)-binding protein n=1 Tax=Peribacillus kribbensis TaxID=356658 RepID=UPI00040593D3|nr:(2Fe-2S)-binding protein [Peribacillus kribbensis]
MPETNKKVLILSVNDEDKDIVFRPADTLLGVLRGKLGLTGAKPGCLNGDCGACTVLVDGIPMKSCIMLAIEAEGHKVTTIEGLINTKTQASFIKHFAFQCGYCTPGFIMVCHSLAEKQPHADKAVIKEWMQSNICRCTSYQEIEEAVASILAEE